jgi:hypothetical protein
MDPAQKIVDANRYMTLATADAHGAPWASPVWFAPDGDREFLWVSDPRTQHSRNLAERPGLTIVIFDSQTAVGHASALYLAATAREVEHGIETFSGHSVGQGLRTWTRENVSGTAPLRLYRARATERWILGAGSERVPLAWDSSSPAGPSSEVPARESEHAVPHLRSLVHRDA